MKLIFLDIDGVLATMKTRFNQFDTDCVAHLNTLLDLTGAKICVSSTWRRGHSTDSLREVCRQGFRVKLPLISQGNQKIADAIVGRTPRLNEYMCRGREIDLWMKHWEQPIDSFVILDDDSDMEPHMDALVKTDTYLGLNKITMNAALDILKKESFPLTSQK